MNYLSTCCDSPPLGNLDEYADPPLGMCQRCREHADFYPVDEAGGDPPSPGLAAALKQLEKDIDKFRHAVDIFSNDIRQHRRKYEGQ